MTRRFDFGENIGGFDGASFGLFLGSCRNIQGGGLEPAI